MSEKPQGKDALMETLRVPSFLLASAVSCRESHTGRPSVIEKLMRRSLPGLCVSERAANESARVTLIKAAYFSWEGMFGVFTYTAPDHGGLGLPVSLVS